jgi:imidazoleglycerol phosphate synthase glutamine amidotransferase subunit HisH
MERLRAAGFVEPIRTWIAADRPFLGICLGLQECCSTAATRRRGRRSRPDGPARGRADAPHIGWNQVERTRPHPAFDGIADGADYFLHSYVGDPVGRDAAADTLATTEHGRRLCRPSPERLLGVQFHPERSGDDGLRLVANVVGLAA